MQGYHVLGFGLGWASAVVALVILPMATQAVGQSSPDAALEQACRATETVAPESCACTVRKSRDVGVSQKDMASLFKDDGRSQPVGQTTFSAFWQVKTQCITEAINARLGTTGSNPLPGVPANMRPGMPLGTPPPATRQPVYPVPPPPLTLEPAEGIVNSIPPFDLPRSAASLEVERGVGITLASEDYDGDGNATLIEKYSFPTFDYVFVTDTGVRKNPKLFLRAQSKGQEDLAEWRTIYSENARVRQEATIAFGTEGSLGRLLTVAVTGSTNNRPQGQMIDDILWDTTLNREIAWTDVFDKGLWNGKIRRDYCAALQSERVLRGTQQNTSCPEFDQLLVDFDRDENGETQLSFTALAYIAGSYAEGPYTVKVPLDQTLLAGVKGPYRDTLGAPDGSGAVALRDRLGEMKSVLAGDIQASDDFYFPRSGAERFTRVAQFDQLFRNARPALFMTLYEAPDGPWGYSIKLDGRQHNLRAVDGSGNSGTKTYSDGVVRVTIQKGRLVSNNPAFGYSIDTITIEKGEERDTFQAINLTAA